MISLCVLCFSQLVYTKPYKNNCNDIEKPKPSQNHLCRCLYSKDSAESKYNAMTGVLERDLDSLPIPSMYGVFTYIWLICMVNVHKCTIHGFYGLGRSPGTPLTVSSGILLAAIDFPQEGDHPKI